MSQPRRRVNPKAFVRDVRAGLNDDDLMSKYGVSSLELERLFRMLVDQGLVTQGDLEERGRLLLRETTDEEPGATPYREDGIDRRRRTPGPQVFYKSKVAWLADRVGLALRSRLTFVATYLLLFVFVTWGVCLFLEVRPGGERRNEDFSQHFPVPRMGAGHAFPGADMPFDGQMMPVGEIARGKDIVAGIVQGRISGSDLEAFSDFPEFRACQRCLEECQQGASIYERGKSQSEAEECRRACLTNCSRTARWLMSQ